jgi:predicted nuclease of predicted toxin-antitoxin system
LANLYLDENVTVRLFEPLASLGHDTVSANHLGHKGRTDAEQLLIATNLGRILVTYDRDDSLLLHEAWLEWSRAWDVPRTHAGIIVIHPVRGFTVDDIARSVHDGLSRESTPLANRIVGWKHHLGWYELRTPGRPS